MTELLRSTFAMAAGLCVFAAPGYSSVFLAFSGSSAATGTITVNGNTSAETLTALSGVPYTSLLITNAPNTAANGTWSLSSTTLAYNFSTNVMTLFGNIGSCQTTTGTGNCFSSGGNAFNGLGSVALETIQFASGFIFNSNGTTPGTFKTNNPTQTSVNVVFNTSTSLTEAQTFLSDLGLSGATGSLTSGGIGGTGSGTSSGGHYNFGATSDTMNITLTATPEPVSSSLIGTGLLGIAWVKRRRRPTQA